MALRFALLAVLFTACVDREASRGPAASDTATTLTTATVSEQAQAPAAARSQFVVDKNGETILVESFLRTNDRVEAELTSPRTSERANAIYTIGPQATVSRVQVSAEGGESAGEQLAVTIDGTRARIEARGKNGEVRQNVVNVPAGTIPAPVNDSIVVVEQIIRRARALGTPTVDVPILPKSLEPSHVTVTLGDQTATVRGTDVVIEARLDGDGNVISATEQRQGLTITRSSA